MRRGFGSTVPRTLNLSTSLYLYCNDPKIESRTGEEKRVDRLGPNAICARAHNACVYYVHQAVALNCDFKTGEKKGGETYSALPNVKSPIFITVSI